MARREYLMRRVCSVDGCNESYHISYSTKRDYNADAKMYREGPPYLCSAHENPLAWIRPENQVYEHTVQAEALPSERLRDRKKLFWHFDDGGLVSSTANKLKVPNYHADADDFPKGTLLRVTLIVEAILPEEQA